MNIPQPVNIHSIDLLPKDRGRFYGFAALYHTTPRLCPRKGEGLPLNRPPQFIDNTCSTVVEYTYDTWGKVLSCTGTLATTLGSDQPFRYRGYVYDAETGWYYLQSRYYSPETCRFISADVLLSTGQGVIGNNSYAYCRNNPIRRVDASGLLDEETGESDIYDLIKGNIKKARMLLLLSVLVASSTPAPCFGVIGFIRVAEATKYVAFYLNVKQDGPMDYKNQARWESALPNLEYPGDDGEEKKYLFNGEMISASDLGNINYGAFGAALGIPLDILLWQAGAAQLRDHWGYGMFESQIGSLKKGWADFFGDQADDYKNIKRGYYLYHLGYFGG